MLTKKHRQTMSGHQRAQLVLSLVKVQCPTRLGDFAHDMLTVAVRVG